MQNSIYFGQIMSISQRYDEGNHLPHIMGSVIDYPIDECYGKGTSGAFYAPFDCKIVKKASSDTNQIWITSISPVITPKFTDYVTILIGHIRQNEYNKLNVGDVFKQKELILHEEKDKLSTGYHNHVTGGRGKILGSGWAKSNKNVWCIATTGGACMPQGLYFIDTSFTRVENNKNIPFVYLKKNESINDNKKYYETLDDLYINKTMNVNNHEYYKNCSNKMKEALKYQGENDYAVIKKGTTITALEIIKKGRYTWIKNYNGYVCLKGASGKYYLKEV